jgi:hypothetical protein
MGSVVSAPAVQPEYGMKGDVSGIIYDYENIMLERVLYLLSKRLILPALYHDKPAGI